MEDINQVSVDSSKNIIKEVAIYAPQPKDLIEEKALVQSTQLPGFKNLGEEHPKGVDFKQLEEVYQKYGWVTAVVDKYVDFTVGSGFYVRSKNKKAQQLVEDLLREVNFDNVLREWLREALLKGNGFLELVKDSKKNIVGLNVVNANDMYVVFKKDSKGKTTGEIEEYIQDLRVTRMSLNDDNVIHFKPDEIAHLTINKIPGKPYGIGIIYPGMYVVNNILKNEKDMHLLVSRKANAPIWAKIGTPEKPASPDAVNNFGKQLEYLNNRMEWATDGNVELSVIDFGEIGKNFETVFIHDKEVLMIAYQIPQVLLGNGNIAEGLAKVQLDAYQRKILSIQSATEKVIETSIIKPYLASQGLNVHVEFEWGEPSNEETTQRIMLLQGLISNPNIASPKFKLRMEQEVASLLGYEENVIETEEQRKQRELTAPQPQLPGGNARQSYLIKESFIEDRDFTLKEWLNFDYQQYVSDIIRVISRDKFLSLKAENEAQEIAGYLSEEKIKKLKEVLKDGFENEKSIKEIAKGIQENVQPGAVYEMVDDKRIAFNEAGNMIQVYGEDTRSLVIARTETTRVSNEGAILQYQDNGIKSYAWITSGDDRVCPICAPRDGIVYEISSGITPPAHVGCRCSTLASDIQ